MKVETYLEYIQKDISNHIFFNRVLDSLSKFEGKEVSKRIETHLQKEFPEYRIFSMWYCMWFQIVIKKEEFQIIIDLATETDKFYSKERCYNHLNPSYGIGAEKRKITFENSTQEQIFELIEQTEKYNQMVTELKELQDLIENQSLERFGSTLLTDYRIESIR